MNFEFSDDQELLREMVRDFTQSEIEPEVKSLEGKHEFPHKLLQKLGNLGILGTSVPAEYGGIKTDSLSFVIALEEISRSFPSLAVIISVHCSLFCNSILEFGSSHQKEKYLPQAAKGEILGAFGLSEPQAGSDAMSLLAKAERKGDFYILNGTKSWITSGNNADTFIIFTKSAISSGERKLSAFIIDKDSPGLRVSKVEEKMGLHSSLTSEISLEDCQVPADNLLGEEGNGAVIAFQGLDVSRIGIAAQSVGLSQRALDEAVKFAKQREAFGKKISDFQAIQFMLADISTYIDSARLLTYRAADLYDKGKPFTKEASMAKLFASEAANKIVYQSLQIHGAYGYSKEFIIEQLYRDARALSIYEGTSEVQRLVISRQLLKN